MGVELELIGPDVEETTAVVVATLGGTVEVVSRYESVVHGDAAGPWRVELDFEYLLQRGREQADSDASHSLLGDLSEAVLRTGAEAIVPVEVVSPPLPLPRLTSAQRLVGELRRCGALGTRAGLTYALGMQFNPELPRCDAATIRAYLKAFLCLEDWLLRRSRVDLTRKLTRYAAPFPSEYARRVVAADYRPELEELVDDYLESNPTRNRTLDLLPLFTELSEEQVRRVVQDERVKARPTLHYRLPNCEIDDPRWGLHLAWADWLQVEHLAADGERLAAACAGYASFLDGSFERLVSRWADGVEPWITPAEDL